MFFMRFNTIFCGMIVKLKPFMKKFLLVCFSAVFCFLLQAQKPSTPKYPSVFWEITGNGLKKPSYLFGTMHVSKKLVFRLSDSFYTAMQNCDEVALELNPEYWQRDMFKMDAAQKEIGNYYKNGTREYITEKSFQLEKYDDDLKDALSSEPSQINSLLYRTYQVMEDFEENTYLDLYIYQTGRKFGKKAGGVEDYYQTENLIYEAYTDMAKEKNKKEADTDGQSPEEIQQQIEQAYKTGNLDLLDSLEKLSFNSPAYLEKFLYRRNEIQANSIDTILKNNSLFVGVGAAHLPGKRGVIELLRKKGYKLRPIIMQDRDAEKKDSIDKMKVPVVFKPVVTEDSLIQMQLPGPLYKRSFSGYSEYSKNDSWQYADMNNGSYYMLTRVKTHAAILGQSTADVMKKIDSMLYENIPGKILKKTVIDKNGYPGYDIVNRTRRGDMQHYNIIATPFEILVFKMSGNDDYVDGKEAETFFNSIKLQAKNDSWQTYSTGKGGFSVMLPQQPNLIVNKSNSDRIDRVEYEATDKQNSNAYFIWKKTLNTYNFLEEDTFDLSLVELSLKKSEIIDKETSRNIVNVNGYSGLKMQFSLKDGGYINAEAILRGPHYYLLAERSSKKNDFNQQFFSSFSFTQFEYPEQQLFADTLLNFSVRTSETPVLDSSLISLMSKTMKDDALKEMQGNNYYWPKSEYALFRNDTTGEAVLVTVQEYPKYYYSPDSAKFWKNELTDSYQDNEMVLVDKKFISQTDSCKGYKTVFRDTNTVREITSYSLLKDNRLYTLTTLADTIKEKSAFIKTFFESFRPSEKKLGPSVFQNKLDIFFNDYYSKDSTLKKNANEAIAHIYFGSKGIDRIMGAIDSLHYGDKDYFELKSKFIRELGYIDDSCCTEKIISNLQDIYNKTSDTAYFQNEVLEALARLTTKPSYTLLKNLLLQDPPVFEDEDDYQYLFDDISDSLKLARNLFPEILQLASIEDYKHPLNDLLSQLVDSNYISAKDYENYFSNLYFDAKIELKKQQNIDEKLLEKEDKKKEDEAENNTSSVNKYYNNNYDDNASSDVDDYSVLLMPFYDTNPAVQKFFEKLLQSKDPDVRLDAATLMIRNNKKVPDSVLENLAAKDDYRAKLLRRLEKIKHTEFFPAKYKNQEDVAKSLLLNKTDIEKFAEIQLVGKQFVTVKNKKGYVYFFKYKAKKDDEDWHIGISGLQPENLKEVSSNNMLTAFSEKKLKNDIPIAQQFADELTKAIFEQYNSAKQFFVDGKYNYSSDYYDEDEDGN